jgi:effector-binding domain-containing protein
MLLNRRSLLKLGLCGAGLSSLPLGAWAAAPEPERRARALVRQETLFAGIRKPIKKRAELAPRIARLQAACRGKTEGPLTHIFRFDTPVDGFDSEIGFPVSSEINEGPIRTHRLRRMHFFSLTHRGPVDKLRETSGRVYGYMDSRGLSPELEMVEVYHQYRPDQPEKMEVEVMAAYLAWPEVYREQLTRVLGAQEAKRICSGIGTITPHTPVDPRSLWVGQSIARLKKHSDPDQQFDILSRVALKRPGENVAKYKRVYDETKDPNAVIRAQNDHLAKGRTGGFVDPPRYHGKVLHLSKVPYNRKAYDAAKTHREKRKAFCFCSLVREAAHPEIDPIFCYRAAGWARQMWEPILGVEFKSCRITHSILKGDDFCAWDYRW